MFDRADAYERFMGRWGRVLAPVVVGFAEIRDGDRVLDVGSGTGALSHAVIDATPTGRITGIDLSPEYVGYASEHCADWRADFRVGDAQELRFEDGAFDAALSSLFLNFMPDPARAVGEMARVTRMGGVVAAAVWDYPAGMRMLRVFWDEAIALDADAEVRDEGHMPLCRRGELAALWRRQGLEAVHEVALTATLRFDSFGDYWAPFLLAQGPAGAYVAGLPDDGQRALEQGLRARLLGGAGDHPFALSARAWAVKGLVAGGGRIPRRRP